MEAGYRRMAIGTQRVAEKARPRMKRLFNANSTLAEDDGRAARLSYRTV